MVQSVDGADSTRTKTVLSDRFVERLDALPVKELRRRRDEALAEREFQSYLRRLLQARRDILAAERGRRESGAAEKPLLERLAGVLADGPRGVGRGEAVRVVLPEEDVAEAERRANAILGEVSLVDPQTLDESQLADAISSLEREERVVSAARAAVIAVHDRFQDELKRRYREDLAAIPIEP